MAKVSKEDLEWQPAGVPGAHQRRADKAKGGAKRLPTGGILRLAIVDDDEVLHFGVRQYLESITSEWALQSYSAPEQALQAIPLSPPAVVLMRAKMLDRSGIDSTRKLKALQPTLPVVLLTLRPSAHEVFMALMAGACGYLVNPIMHEELVRAVISAARGFPVLCCEAQRIIVRHLNSAAASTAGAALTMREQEVITLLFDNRSDKEIAKSLGIGHGTVHVHMANLFKKLDAHNRAEALAKFVALR